MILAKKRRLSQTDSSKSRKQSIPQAATTPVAVSDTRQRVVVNGDNLHASTTEEPSQREDNTSNVPPSIINSNDTSPHEAQQPAASCSGTDKD